ncbi:hypothetical protein ACTFIR_003867 [Dictyostelium discoideum]
METLNFTNNNSYSFGGEISNCDIKLEMRQFVKIDPALIFTVELILRTLYQVYIDQKFQDQGVKKQASVGQQSNSENVDVDEVIEIEEELAVEEIDKEAQAELNIENRDQLEAPLGISEEIINKIKSLIDAIYKKENNDEIVWYSQSNTLVFGVKSIQDLVFKMDRMDNDKESCKQNIPI